MPIPQHSNKLLFTKNTTDSESKLAKWALSGMINLFPIFGASVTISVEWVPKPSVLQGEVTFLHWPSIVHVISIQLKKRGLFYSKMPILLSLKHIGHDNIRQQNINYCLGMVNTQNRGQANYWLVYVKFKVHSTIQRRIVQGQLNVEQFKGNLM